MWAGLVTAGRLYIDMSTASSSASDNRRIMYSQLKSHLETELRKLQTLDVRTESVHQVQRLSPSMRSELNGWLHPELSKMDSDIAMLRKNRTVGTREWLFSQIHSWAEGHPESEAFESPIFWLTAVAGAGKSVIAACMTDWLDKKGLLAGCFFFKVSSYGQTFHCPDC